MIDDHQSQFAAEQALIQTPPELDPTLHPPTQHEAQKANPRKHMLVIGGSVLGGVVVLSVILGIFFKKPATVSQVATPPPEEAVQQLNSTQQALKTLQDEVDAANPQDYSFPPPPVDMNITF